MFIDQFLKICKLNKIAPTKILLELGYSKANLTKWKNGGKPSLEVLAKIADYFDVSTDYLLGKTDTKKAPELSEADANFAEFYELYRNAPPHIQAEADVLLRAAYNLLKKQ